MSYRSLQLNRMLRTTCISISKTLVYQQCAKCSLHRKFLCPSLRIAKDLHGRTRRHFCYSKTYLQNQNCKHDKVSLENMFSEENKSRVQKKLETLEPIRQVKVQENPRCAAVLIVMCYVDGTPGLLYMERSNQLRQHRGEICFPGGMAESSDTDIIHTALRETREEIGLHIERDQVWGVMQNIPSRDGAILVTPVVAFAGNVDLTKLILDKKEVESVFVQSLSSLCDPHNARYTQFRSGNGYTIPVFLGAHRIWGLSAIITHMFLHILAPGLYTFRLRHRT